MTVAGLLAESRAALSLREARLLLGHALGLALAALEARPERTVEPQAAAHFRALAARRAAGEPIAYLTGRREFYGLDFHVTPDVLIPREETELLVDIAREAAREDPSAQSMQPLRILDLGAGSGCLAVAVAKALPQARVTAVDASAAALAVARENAIRHDADIRWLSGDWFAPLAGECFDLILSNPPYVAADDPHLAQGDVRFEPRAALIAGADGLADLRRIIAAAPPHLAPGGWLWLEHGYDQAPAVAALLTEAGLTGIAQRRDLAGILRVSGGRQRGNPAH
ncbi:MAG: peptide chain release factor N(5)-glutamine methyltransferase [Zoogloeaceae bacterium]|nr:peptide chain release factor N(5)-glutamine methyltransferase [Zoogloeaceae bacterium]